MAGEWPDEAALTTALQQVVDPELGANIVDLGLIYGIERNGSALRVLLTFTSPACPVGPLIEDEVRAVLDALRPVGGSVAVDVVWDPPWGPERIAPHTRRNLGWDE